MSSTSSVCRVVELTGDVTPDMRAIAQADLIVTTPEKWDGVSRSWQNRSYVQKVSILIIDEIHLLGKASVGGALAVGGRALGAGGGALAIGPASRLSVKPDSAGSR